LQNNYSENREVEKILRKEMVAGSYKS